KGYGQIVWRVAICFIDVFSPTFEDHLRDLDDILTLLEDAGLTVSPQEFFVGYHSLKILDQLVDRFGMTRTAERADAILWKLILRRWISWSTSLAPADLIDISHLITHKLRVRSKVLKH